MKVKYVGPDTFPGLPARDMEEEEYDALSLNMKVIVKASDSYKMVGKVKATDDDKKDED